MRITVSGLPGSGTTSLAKYLSEHHNFELILQGKYSVRWRRNIP